MHALPVIVSRQPEGRRSTALRNERGLQLLLLSRNPIRLGAGNLPHISLGPQHTPEIVNCESGVAIVLLSHARACDSSRCQSTIFDTRCGKRG